MLEELKKNRNVILSVTCCSSPNSPQQYCWSSSLRDLYTVFQECRLKPDMLGPSKHNRGQKPQRITHNQSPKEFPWTKLLTRKLCSGGEDRGAAESPDWNSMDSAAGDKMSLTLSTLLCATSDHRLKYTYVHTTYWKRCERFWTVLLFLA